MLVASQHLFLFYRWEVVILLCHILYYAWLIKYDTLGSRSKTMSIARHDVICAYTFSYRPPQNLTYHQAPCEYPVHT